MSVIRAEILFLFSFFFFSPPPFERVLVGWQKFVFVLIFVRVLLSARRDHILSTDVSGLIEKLKKFVFVFCLFCFLNCFVFILVQNPGRLTWARLQLPQEQRYPSLRFGSSYLGKATSAARAALPIPKIRVVLPGFSYSSRKSRAIRTPL